MFGYHQTPATQKPFRSVSKKKATILLEKRLAKLVSQKAIQLTFVLSRSPIAARDYNLLPKISPIFLQGGLSKTEHGPKHPHGSK